MARQIEIPDKLYFKIGEVSDLTGIKPYVLRYWESEFNIVKPSKTKTNQRLYKRKEVEMILEIKKLLYEDKFTIAGAKKILQERHRGRSTTQLTLGFEDAKTKQVLAKIKEELIEIKGLIAKG
ncbi:MAG: MerR family transcriptional regulator [Candidatus Alcyoniella australis]|nr:MerR family transcriptional regulator [Candidatus Alcyoniella australis]